MAKTYMEMLGQVSPSMGGARRVRDMVAALTPPATGGAAALMKQDQPRPSAADAALGMVPGLVGGGLGALAWKRHRVLGFLAGHAVGSVVRPLVTGKGRMQAFTQVGVDAAVIGGALLWKKHPFWGGVIGLLAGATVAGFVKDSASRDIFNKWKSEA